MKKHQQRMRHVITRDAFPYVAFSLKKFPVSYKARYVNDVHLPRFGGGRGATRPTIGRPSRNVVLYGTATRNPLGITGDSKDFSPSNSWNDTKSTVLRQLPQATLAPVRGSGVGNKEHPTPLCLSVLPPHPKRVAPTHPQRVIPTTPLWVYRHTPCRYYRQPPRGYYRKRQRGREIARRRS